MRAEGHTPYRASGNIKSDGKIPQTLRFVATALDLVCGLGLFERIQAAAGECCSLLSCLACCAIVSCWTGQRPL